MAGDGITVIEVAMLGSIEFDLLTTIEPRGNTNPIQVDVGFGDVITPALVKIKYPVLRDSPVPHRRLRRSPCSDDEPGRQDLAYLVNRATFTASVMIAVAANLHTLHSGRCDSPFDFGFS